MIALRLMSTTLSPESGEQIKVCIASLWCYYQNVVIALAKNQFNANLWYRIRSQILNKCYFKIPHNLLKFYFSQQRFKIQIFFMFLCTFLPLLLLPTRKIK